MFQYALESRLGVVCELQIRQAPLGHLDTCEDTHPLYLVAVTCARRRGVHTTTAVGHATEERADPCQSLVPPAALEGPIPRTSRGLTIKRPGCRLAIGPLTCISW